MKFKSLLLLLSLRFEDKDLLYLRTIEEMVSATSILISWEFFMFTFGLLSSAPLSSDRNEVSWKRAFSQVSFDMRRPWETAKIIDPNPAIADF